MYILRIIYYSTINIGTYPLSKHLTIYIEGNTSFPPPNMWSALCLTTRKDTFSCETSLYTQSVCADATDVVMTFYILRIWSWGPEYPILGQSLNQMFYIMKEKGSQAKA